MKKKLVTSIMAATLVAAVGIGSTLAYLQDETGTKTNTFTIGDVKIDLDEPEWDPTKGEDMLPGATVSKNPIVTNVGQTTAFIGVRVDGMNEVVSKGFLVKSDKATDGIVLDAVYNNKELTNDSVVFAWNPDYTLVDANGAKIDAGTDDKLTAGELKDAAGAKDVLFFAYEKEVNPGKQTSSLFDEVKLDADVLGAPKTYTIVKHFVDKEDHNKLLEEDANGLIQGTPAKNDAGEYIYNYTIKEDVVRTVYKSYEDAKKAIDILEDGDTTANYEFNMKVKAAAIQSTNESNDDWADTTEWFKELPAEGFRNVI